MFNPQVMLHQGLVELDSQLSQETQARILAYVELLAKWNHKYNLTAVRDIPEMISRHVLDSMAVVPYIQGQRILDVGTGAGLPGIMLALARPNWQCVLLDSHAKKTRFVTQVVVELGLSNVEVVCERIERYQPKILFDTVISRALSSLVAFYMSCARLVSKDGCLLAMKGVYPDSELNALPPLSHEVYTLRVPTLEAQRHLVEIHPNQFVIDISSS